MKLYIGIDMGWKSFRYEVRNQAGKRIKIGGANSSPESLLKFLENYQYDNVSVQVAFEAGSQMYWVHDVVEGLGMDSYPFHAGDFYLSVKSKNKTDKKDAEKIAKAASKENLPPRIVVPNEEERELRELVKERQRYKKDLVKNGNRLHAHGIGLGFNLDCGCLSQNLSNWDKALEKFKGTRCEVAAKNLYRTVLVHFQILEEIEEKLKELGNSEKWKKARKQLESIPGFGFWTSMSLLAWCGSEATRFTNSRQAASYFGLTGRIYESGSISRHGGITKNGPPMIRALMIQVAWAFLRSQEGKRSRWGQWFLRRTSKNSHQKKKSVVGLARKLLTAAVACLQKGTEWNADVLNGEFQTG